MQEIRRVPIDSPDNEPFELVLGYAETDKEIEAAQRLRYDVYVRELNVRLPLAVDGVDKDKFDPWCRHLVVMDTTRGCVVGTYRILSPENAKKAGEYYSSTEFDMKELNDVLPQLAECGRSCIHKDYRDGMAIMLLWEGLARFLHTSNVRYLFGCASVSLQDGGVQAAQVYQQSLAMIKPDMPRVYPHLAYPLDKLPDVEPSDRLPPLIKGYLKIGARICGEPAWDKDFNSADFPVIIDYNSIKKAYLRHWGII